MSPALLTRKEAAEIAGLSVNSIKNAVDKGIVPERKTRGVVSGIEADDIAVLVTLEALPGLSVALKKRVRKWMRADREARLRLTEALVVERIARAEAKARDADRYARLRDKWITTDPEIRGGEPIIRGSRVSVHTLAERLTHGESDEILDEDFPHIPKEARDVAVVYARTHPRRGRPRKRGLAA
jgi:uncharacterized protein (DUF433 family)